MDKNSRKSLFRFRLSGEEEFCKGLILYAHYLYFDLARWSYLQFSVIVPYIALGPSLIAGLLTLGTMSQTVRAFGKVQDSFQFLVQSWPTIVELLSIYKRLNAFEQQIKEVT